MRWEQAVWDQILSELLNFSAGRTDYGCRKTPSFGIAFFLARVFPFACRFVMMLTSKGKFVFHKNCHRKGWDQKDFIVELKVRINTSEVCLYEEVYQRRCIGSSASVFPCDYVYYGKLYGYHYSSLIIITVGFL